MKACFVLWCFIPSIAMSQSVVDGLEYVTGEPASMDGPMLVCDGANWMTRNTTNTYAQVVSAMATPEFSAWYVAKTNATAMTATDFSQKFDKLLCAFALVAREHDEKWCKAFRVLSQDIPAVRTSLSNAGFTTNDLTAKSVQDWVDAVRAKAKELP